MTLKMLRAKIHRATVTEACVDYVGSITIDEDILDATGILPGECVVVADVDNASRFETYVFRGSRGSGVFCVNGAAAHLVKVGHKIIIMAYAYLDETQAKTLKPRVAVMDDANNIKEIMTY
ncbi:MAG TPA: aspartate 1-decarboxylase [Phycisphaerae bacterium]|nr:aspartate 1-decarboxylase [Phycisphaerae bacterium]HPS52752.1 aspartate 1-decarboxylase [Phycisphaerae bacterium]